MNHFLDGFVDELVKVAVSKPSYQTNVPSPEFGNKLMSPAPAAPKPIASSSAVPKIKSTGLAPKKEEMLGAPKPKKPSDGPIDPYASKGKTLAQKGRDILSDPSNLEGSAKKSVSRPVKAKRDFDKNPTKRQLAIRASGGTRKQKRIRAERAKKRVARSSKKSGGPRFEIGEGTIESVGGSVAKKSGGSFSDRRDKLFRDRAESRSMKRTIAKRDKLFSDRASRQKSGHISKV